MLIKDRLEDYFCLYANCRLVKGIKRSTICDTHYRKIELIPNDLYEMLLEFNKGKVSDVLNAYGISNRSVIIEYLEYLYESEYIFFVSDKDEIDRFVDINIMWDSPHLIENAILEHGDDQLFRTAIDQLDKCGCRAVEIKMGVCHSIEDLEKVVMTFERSRIEFISIRMIYVVEIAKVDFWTIVDKYPRIGTIVIYLSPFNDDSHDKVYFTRKDLSANSCCGHIDPKFFRIDLNSFSENHFYNSCLNRKVSIDYLGNVRNCPSLPRIFGNISHTPLDEIVAQHDFREISKITKDSVNVCKGCEFRMVCSDCRAYLEDPSDIYSKPLKCGYDPIEGVWHDWVDDRCKRAIFNDYLTKEM